jgi:hypothetical protein
MWSFEVPSPPCGMVTLIGLGSFWMEQKEERFRAHRVGWRPCCSLLGLLLGLRSEPTVWDGDQEHHQILAGQGFDGSEPTVWDGDFLWCNNIQLRTPKVPSPPCGMATFSGAIISNSAHQRFRAHRVGWRLSLVQ